MLHICQHLKIVCYNPQISFFFFLKGVLLTNPNDIPLNQAQLFSSREINILTTFKNGGRLYLTEPGPI
jgi:hypothetical protein